MAERVLCGLSFWQTQAVEFNRTFSAWLPMASKFLGAKNTSNKQQAATTTTSNKQQQAATTTTHFSHVGWEHLCAYLSWQLVFH